jgi:O-antigen/teichoic acid export membrane protein
MGISESRMMASGTAVAPIKTSAPVVVAQPLRIGFGWSLFGWVGYAGCQWLMLSVMAKLGNAVVVGQFAFALALSAPVFMLTNLQLRGVQSTDAHSEYHFSDYVTLRLIGSILALIVIAAICPFLKITWSAAIVVLLVALFKSLESAGDVVAGLMQKFEKLDSAAIALLLRGGISIAAFGIPFAIWHSLPVSLILWASCAATVIANYDFRIAGKLATFEGGMRLKFRWKALRSLAITSLPLGLVSAITSFNTNVPRYTIQHVLSVADLGIFASIAYPIAAATIVSNSLGQATLARLSRLFAERRIKEFNRLVLKLVAFGAGLAAVAVLAVSICGDWFLTLIYTSEYARHGNLFTILALTAGLNSIGCFLVYALTAARQFRIQLPISLVCTLTTFICSMVFVPRFHLVGAAMALAVSALLLITLTSITLQITVRRHAAS